MSEELNLVADLALILISAGIFTVISKALKQPLILGYILAGFVVSPHLGLFPSVGNVAEVEQWSEIGIIFLMFTLGLEFSFKKLLKVGSSALIAAGIKCIGMFVLGMAAGTAMRWTMMESIFLGGLLSMSSTTIVLKSYDEMGLKSKPFASLIFGSLVVEDLIAILMMVLFPTMAVSNQFAGKEMMFGMAKLVFFLILWFLVGIYVLPTLLKKARRYLTDEILLIIAVGLCFGMVALAGATGFSSALGAFVMGSILAETVEGEHIEKLMGGIKNLFGAIFFVSVGMMIDPVVIAQHWGTILIITIIVMVGHVLCSAGGVLLTGKGLESATWAGFSLSQLGEFGFILASLGISLGVMRDFIYPVIIAVSVITTFTTPYMIKAAAPMTGWLKKKLPEDILKRIDPPQTDGQTESEAEHSEWKKLLSSYFLRILMYGVIVIAILLFAQAHLDKLINLLPIESKALKNVIWLCITMLAMGPFLYGLGIANGSIGQHASKLLREKESNKWPILSLMLIRILITIGFMLAAVMSRLDLSWWTILLIIAGGMLVFVISKRSVHRFSRLEGRFMANLNSREEQERRKAPVAASVRSKMAGYDVHIDGATLSADSSFAGAMLKDLPLRSETGVNIVKIIRGSSSITIPSGDERVYPGDRIVAVGTSSQLAAFMEMMQASIVEKTVSNDPDDEFVVETIELGVESHLTGQTLRSSNLRSSGCMVISILHGDEFMTNPRPDYRFTVGDIVWIAGARRNCAFFMD